MEKRINYDVFMSVKRVAQACNPIMSKRESTKAKIEKLEEEYKMYDAQVAALEAGIKSVTGFRVEELVKKVIEPGVDVNGKPKKTTKYLPTDIVTYDTEKRQYVVTIPDTEPARVPAESAYEQPATVVETKEEPAVEVPTQDNDAWGSDFDIDKEKQDIEPMGSDVFDF